MQASEQNDQVQLGKKPAVGHSNLHALPKMATSVGALSRGDALHVAVLTGNGDKPYALGLASALASQNICLDFIASSEIDGPELRQAPLIKIHNLRGDQRANVSLATKILRVAAYYCRLVFYAARAKPRIFHILWNDKLELFDRTALMLFYRFLGKQVVFTAHNVNAGKRDGNDNLLNRLTLKVQYQLTNHIFVHTAKMKKELLAEFGAPPDKVSVIPFGINNTVPNSKLGPQEAKRLLRIRSTDKTMLFFGNIAPYKGLEYLVAAFGQVLPRDPNYRLIIAGKVAGREDYWSKIQEEITLAGAGERIIERIEYVPDEQTELYFKAADVLILPYSHVFQSGVLFLGYSFGLPVIAADVGSLREDIIDGRTGYVFRPKDPADLAKTIESYFSSDMFRELEHRREEIRAFANDRYSWAKVGQITRNVYEKLLVAR
jgi:D-inositol-3-phosphate glycosyltransferase